MAGVLMNPAYVAMVISTAFAAIAGVFLVLAVRAFGVLNRTCTDRARIENDRRRIGRPILECSRERSAPASA